MASRRPSVDRLRREIERRLDNLDSQLAETERRLLERQAEAEPVEAPLLPVLRIKKPRKKPHV